MLILVNSLVMARRTAHALPLTAERVEAQMRAEIGRRWKAGERLPPIPKLAAHLRAGRHNTHRAVRALVAEGLLSARPKLGTVVTDAAATGGASGDLVRGARLGCKRIAIVGSHQFDLFTRPASNAAAQLLAGQGMDVRIVDTDPMCRAGVVPDIGHADAAIFLNAGPPGDAAHDDMPAVIVSSAAMPTAGRNCDIVGVDSEQGACLAGRWLNDAGVDRVAFLGVRHPSSRRYDLTTELRLRGFEQGFERIVANDLHLIASSYIPECGAMLFEQYRHLPNRPAAVFAASDELAVGFIFASLGHGLRPGRDYQIVGFDGQARGRALLCGPLTTVDVPMEQMGRLAAELLIRRFAEPDRPPQRVMVGCQMFSGKTAGAKG